MATNYQPQQNVQFMGGASNGNPMQAPSMGFGWQGKRGAPPTGGPSSAYPPNYGGGGGAYGATNQYNPMQAPSMPQAYHQGGGAVSPYASSSNPVGAPSSTLGNAIHQTLGTPQGRPQPFVPRAPSPQTPMSPDSHGNYSPTQMANLPSYDQGYWMNGNYVNQPPPGSVINGQPTSPQTIMGAGAPPTGGYYSGGGFSNWQTAENNALASANSFANANSAPSVFSSIANSPSNNQPAPAQTSGPDWSALGWYSATPQQRRGILSSLNGNVMV